MSFFGRPERNAIALQVADSLDSYEATMNAWLVEPGNLLLYRKLSTQIESIRMMSSSAMPQATGALADLLLAHTDLTFISLKKHLVKLGAGASDSGDQLTKATERFQFTVSEMRSICVRFATSPRR